MSFSCSLTFRWSSFEDLVVARVLDLFLVQLLSSGRWLKDLVGARVRYVFLAQLLSQRGSALITLSVRGSGIFFVLNYFTVGVA